MNGTQHYVNCDKICAIKDASPSSRITSSKTNNPISLDAEKKTRVPLFCLVVLFEYYWCWYKGIWIIHRPACLDAYISKVRFATTNTNLTFQKRWKRIDKDLNRNIQICMLNVCIDIYIQIYVFRNGENCLQGHSETVCVAHRLSTKWNNSTKVSHKKLLGSLFGHRLTNFNCRFIQHICPMAFKKKIELTHPSETHFPWMASGESRTIVAPFRESALCIALWHPPESSVKALLPYLVGLCWWWWKHEARSKTPEKKFWFNLVALYAE